MKESGRIKRWLLDLPPNRRAFRINAGRGWISNKLRWVRNTLVLLDPRPLQAGPPGWHDCVGWTTVEITSEMVGQKIAIFTFSEHKQPGEKYRKEQRELAALLKSMGGICEIITE